MIACDGDEKGRFDVNCFVDDIVAFENLCLLPQKLFANKKS